MRALGLFITPMRLLGVSLLTLVAFALACNLRGPAPDEPELSDPATATAPPEDAQVELGQIAATLSPAAAPATPEPAPLRVAYTDGGDIWAVEVGSAPYQLTNSGGVTDVRISDDGEWIAYVIRDPNEDTAELRATQFDGSQEHVLLSPADFDALHPLNDFVHYTLSNMDFLPGSYQLLFNTRGVFQGPGLAKSDDLLSVNVENAQVSVLLPPGEGGDFTASPSGERLAIVQPDNVGFVDADGSNPNPGALTFPWVITYSEYFFYPLPVWTGDKVIVPVPSEDPFFGSGGGSVWDLPSEPGDAQTLAAPAGDLFWPQREEPLISPDGSYAATFQDAESEGEMYLVLHELSSGTETIYDTGFISWKGWAPDSIRFAYTKAGGLDLWKGELGAGPVPIGSGTSPRWVNSEEFLYLAGVPTNWTLSLADVLGNTMALASPAGDFVAFDFAN